MIRECPMERLGPRDRDTVRCIVDRYRDHHLGGEGMVRELDALGFSGDEARTHVELVRATDE